MKKKQAKKNNRKILQGKVTYATDNDRHEAKVKTNSKGQLLCNISRMEADKRHTKRKPWDIEKQRDMRMKKVLHEYVKPRSYSKHTGQEKTVYDNAMKRKG